MTRFVANKDPSDVIDYTIDWSDTLSSSSPSDTIGSSDWTADNGVTVNKDSNTTTTATVWVSGGTAGAYCNLTNTVTTASSPARTYQRTIYLRLQHA